MLRTSSLVNNVLKSRSKVLNFDECCRMGPSIKWAAWPTCVAVFLNMNPGFSKKLPLKILYFKFHETGGTVWGGPYTEDNSL